MTSTKMKIAALAVAAVALLTSGKARAGEQELLQKIDALEKRLADLEGKAVTTNSVTAKTLDFIGKVDVGGGIMASWFSDLSNPGPAGTTIPRAGVGTYNHNAFSVNLAEIYLAKPVTVSADKWDAGFKVTTLLGEDVAGLADGLDFGGGRGAIFEAYVSANVPVLNGVVVKAGKFATYIGNEVVEPWANAHITYGNQFPLIEPFTHTGIAAETAINDKLSLMLSVNNGWDQTFETGDGASFLGQLKFTPCDKSSIILNGFVGPETGQGSELRSGMDLIGSYQFSDKLSATVQADWGMQNLDTDTEVSWYAVGSWLSYDVCNSFGLAVRGDWMKGTDGFPGTGFTAGLTEKDITLLSTTFTATYRTPVPGLETRAELRYDNSTDDAFFGGPNDRWIFGLAALYSF